MSSNETKLPERDAIDVALDTYLEDPEPGGVYAEGFRKRMKAAIVAYQMAGGIEMVPGACYTPASDEEVQIALSEYRDCEEMNTPEVNMKAALDSILYRRGSKPSEQSEGAIPQEIDEPFQEQAENEANRLYPDDKPNAVDRRLAFYRGALFGRQQFFNKKPTVQAQPEKGYTAEYHLCVGDDPKCIGCAAKLLQIVTEANESQQADRRITASIVETWRKNTVRTDEVLGFVGETPITAQLLLNALAELTDNA